MSGVNDGGPAFPVESTTHLEYASICGMTLRDYFAAAALQGMLAADGNDPRWTGRDASPEYQRGGGKWLNPVGVSRQAYDIANAMIAERTKPFPKTDLPVKCPACGSREYHRDGDWDSETGEQTAAYMTCQACGHSGPIE